jgi:hypothetical protein
METIRKCERREELQSLYEQTNQQNNRVIFKEMIYNKKRKNSPSGRAIRILQEDALCTTAF